MDPQGVKHRLVSLRDVIDNKGQTVVIMTSQTLEVKQVPLPTCTPGSFVMFGNNLGWVFFFFLVDGVFEFQAKKIKI